VRPVTAHRILRPIFRVLFHPISCAVIYTLVLTTWHAPDLYDYALRNKSIHVLEHIMFFGSALFYWWPVVSPSRELPPISHGSQIIYLAAVTITMTPLFAFIAFSDNILYPTYEYAPRIIPNFPPDDDQLLGAAIMKIGSLAVTFVFIAIAFYRWYQQSERSVGKGKD
jgi:putative membrane protein